MNMETMIDTAIEAGRMEAAVRMEWVELVYNTENDDFDKAFIELFKIQKNKLD